jgi:hypothetical protein
MEVVAAPETQSHGPISQNGARRRLRGFAKSGGQSPPVSNRSSRRNLFTLVLLSAVWWLSLVPSLHGKEHKRKVAARDYGLGFSTEIAAPESEVMQAVEDVVNDGIIQGSKEFNKDKYIESASPATSSSLFPEWKQPGHVYYKVRTSVLAPLNFKESRDEGTLAVRYVVQAKGDSKTIVRIDAVFAEEFLRTVHPSDGSVENAECHDIQDRIDAVEAEKKQVAEREKQRQEILAQQIDKHKKEADEAAALASAQSSAQTLDQRVESLRRRAERVVKAPGGPLKSAPFQSASNVKSLEAGEEVVILIVTPYWYGVETTDRQHGWMNRRQLEPLP